MKTDCLTLGSGRRLEKRRGGWVMLPGEMAVGVEIDGGAVTVTDPETGKRLQDIIVDPGSDMAKKRAAKKSTGRQPERTRQKVYSAKQFDRPAAAPRKGDWWRAYTQFVDVIGPWLPLATREVWHQMLRKSDKWVVETSARTMATAAKIDKGTASSAFATLEAVGLIWTIWKSSDKTKPSKYGLHPQPAECLAKVLRWK